MSTPHWKGTIVPTAGDDLLAAWPVFADTAGIYIPCASVAEARVVLADAISKGAVVTPAAPAAFLIGSGPQRVLYIADGSKNAGTGAYQLSPVNERELISQPSTDNGTYTYADGMGARVVATSTLSARPYDRMVEVDGCLYGAVTASVDLGIHIGTKRRYVRFTAGQNTQALHLTAKVLAGVATTINLVVWPRLSGSSIYLAGAEDYVGLDIATSPVSMA